MQLSFDHASSQKASHSGWLVEGSSLGLCGSRRTDWATPLPAALPKAADRVAHRVVSDWSDEETDQPLIADHRNYYKVEK